MHDSTATALAALPRTDATAAWSFLVERHGPDVWRVVRSLHRHHEEAEDAYQDAWLHLRSAAAAFRPGPGGEAAARAWVLRVACTRILDGLRRMKVRRHAELLPETEPAAPPQWPYFGQVLTVCTGHPVARLPQVEWAMWWGETTARWESEGLSPSGRYELCRHFGLDVWHQTWTSALHAECPFQPPHHGAGVLAAAPSYDAVEPFVGTVTLDRTGLNEGLAMQAAGEGGGGVGDLPLAA